MLTLRSSRFVWKIKKKDYFFFVEILRLNPIINNSAIKNTNETNQLSPLLVKNRFSRPFLSNTNNEQQIEKVIFELIQTERSYVQVSE